MTSILQDTQLTPQDIKFLDENGRVAGDWYKFMEDMYQFSGLAKQNFPLFQDLAVTSLSMTPEPSSPPTLNGLSSPLKCYAFDASTPQAMHFQLFVGHGYVAGTDVRPFVQWAPSTGGTGNVRWELSLSWANIGDGFAPPQTFLLTSAAGGNAFVHNFVDTTARLSGGAKKFSSVILGTILRDAGNVADTYPDAAFLLSAGVHFMNSAHGTVKVWP